MKIRKLYPLLFTWLLLAAAVPVKAGGDNEAKGDAAYERADYKKAVKEYKKAVKAAPNDAGLHYKLARAYFKKGEMGDAMSEFIRTTNLDPNHEGAYQFIGDYFLTKNELDKAAKAGAIHRNKTDRKKQRLSAKLAALQAKAVAGATA